jgi:hypothetical protein
MSSDGIKFDLASPLQHSPDALLINGSTTDIVHSRADAPLFFADEINGIGSNWQLRETLKGRVFTGGLVYNSAGQPVSDGTVETFLPSAGTCSNAIGAYAVTAAANKLFRFAMWPRLNVSTPIFVSTFDLNPTDAIKDVRFAFPRIGEYTAVDCDAFRAIAAWTDLRNHKAEIWGAIVPLSTAHTVQH